MAGVPFRTCKTCSIGLPLHSAFFSPHKRSSEGFQRSCRVCMCAAAAQDKPRTSHAYLWANYRAASGERVCMTCCQAKPATPDHFYRRSKASHGLMRQCRVCYLKARENDEVKEHVVPDGASKTCNACLEAFPATLEFFYRQKKGKYGLDGRCKQCAVAKRDRVKVLAYGKEWYALNAEKVIARQRRKNEQDIVSFRARRATQNRNRRARILGNGGTHTLEDVKRIHDGQKGRCWWCSKLVKGKYEVDHRIPVAKGGTNGPDNLVISCSACNRSKGARMPWEMDVPRLF